MSSEVVNPRHRFIKERVLPEIGPISLSYLVDFYYRDLAYYEKARWRGTWAREGGGGLREPGDLHLGQRYQWLLGGVDTAYRLLGQPAPPEHRGRRTSAMGWCTSATARTASSSPPASVRRAEGTRWLSIQGGEGEIFSVKPWLYQIDFALRDQQKEQRLRAELEAYVASLDGPGYGSWDDSHAPPGALADARHRRSSPRTSASARESGELR